MVFGFFDTASGGYTLLLFRDRWREFKNILRFSGLSAILLGCTARRNHDLCHQHNALVGNHSASRVVVREEASVCNQTSLPNPRV